MKNLILSVLFVGFALLFAFSTYSFFAASAVSAGSAPKDVYAVSNNIAYAKDRNGKMTSVSFNGKIINKSSADITAATVSGKLVSKTDMAVVAAFTASAADIKAGSEKAFNTAVVFDDEMAAAFLAGEFILQAVFDNVVYTPGKIAPPSINDGANYNLA